MGIDISGFSKLNDFEQQNVRRIAEASHEKLLRLEQNCSVELRLNTIDKGGSMRYVVEGRVVNPSIIASAQTEGYDLNAVIHALFTKFENELLHKKKE